MLKIMKERWDLNKNKLEHELRTRKGLNNCDYHDLVTLTFETIFNSSAEDDYGKKLDLDSLSRIDDGDYQGTLLFVIPFEVYQPCDGEYIMTYIGYGSCSGCDALQAAQEWTENDLLEDWQVKDFMSICKSIICNTVKPYNYGWREDDDFNPVEETVVG